MSNGSNSNSGGLTGWIATHVAAPLLIAAVVGLAGWAAFLHNGHGSQEKAIEVHEWRLNAADVQHAAGEVRTNARLDRIDAKLDRILEGQRNVP